MQNPSIEYGARIPLKGYNVDLAIAGVDVNSDRVRDRLLALVQHCVAKPSREKHYAICDYTQTSKDFVNGGKAIMILEPDTFPSNFYPWHVICERIKHYFHKGEYNQVSPSIENAEEHPTQPFRFSMLC